MAIEGKNTIRPITAVIALIIIILICMLITEALHQNNKIQRKNKIQTFFLTLTAFGIFITFLFYYSIVELQQQQQVIYDIQVSTEFGGNATNVVSNDLAAASTEIPSFVSSIRPLTTCPLESPPDESTFEACIRRQSLSVKIFTLWQDLLLNKDFLVIDFPSIIANFLQFANSPQLKEQWDYLYINFSARTQSLGNLLFEYALPITTQTPEEYQKVTQEFLADPRVRELIY